jgi:serpin B
VSTTKLLAPLGAVALLLSALLVPARAEEKPSKAETQARALARCNNRFGIELMQKLHKEGENLFISPLSIATAMQMAACGAKGDTRSEMEKVMHIEGLDLPAHNKALINECNSRKDFRLAVANSLWSDKARVTLNEEYVKEVREFFAAEARALDFSDKASVKIINDWIAGKTNQKIKDMLDRIPGDAVSYLVNAVHFKGGWSHKFNARLTKETDFNLADGKKKKVKMMRLGGEELPHVANADFEAVGLPFGEDREAVMWVILPARGKKLADVISGLTADKVAALSEADHENGNVQMPRFSLTYKQELVPTLKALGMKLAFEGGDFSRFGSSPMGPIVIGRVLHQAILEVDEEGAEAAAATVVEWKAESAPARPFNFIADRPFAVAIVDSKSGSVLFSGAVYDPQDLNR